MPKTIAPELMQEAASQERNKGNNRKVAKFNSLGEVQAMYAASDEDYINPDRWPPFIRAGIRTALPYLLATIVGEFDR